MLNLYRLLGHLFHTLLSVLIVKVSSCRHIADILGSSNCVFDSLVITRAPCGRL